MISNNVSQLKKGDKSQVDNSRLNVSGKEALVIVDGRVVFYASIDLKKKLLPILLVLQNGFNNNPVPDVRVWLEIFIPFGNVVVRAYWGCAI